MTVSDGMIRSVSFPAVRDGVRKTTIALDAHLGAIFRQIAKFENRKVSALFNDMLVVYLREKHPRADLQTEGSSRGRRKAFATSLGRLRQKERKNG